MVFATCVCHKVVPIMNVTLSKYLNIYSFEYQNIYQTWSVGASHNATRDTDNTWYWYLHDTLSAEMWSPSNVSMVEWPVEHDWDPTQAQELYIFIRPIVRASPPRVQLIVLALELSAGCLQYFAKLKKNNWIMALLFLLKVPSSFCFRF